MVVPVFGGPDALCSADMTAIGDELRDAGAFDYYELRPREIICYWRSLNPQAEHRLAITLTAAVPGEYTAPASRTE